MASLDEKLALERGPGRSFLFSVVVKGYVKVRLRDEGVVGRREHIEGKLIRLTLIGDTVVNLEFGQASQRMTRVTRYLLHLRLQLEFCSVSR